MKRNVLYLMTAIVIMVGWLSVSAFAAEEPVPDLDFSNAVGDEAGEGYAWDHANKILTLTNIRYSTNSDTIICVPHGTSIRVVGENSLTSAAESATAIRVMGEAVIEGVGENASLTANGGINTPDTVVNAGLSLLNVDVNIARNAVSIRNDNGTRGENGAAGTASFRMDNSYLYCGPVFVGAQVSSNHSYTRSSAVFSMTNNSSIDIQGGGKQAMIFAWGDCGVDFDVVDSNVKIWNSGWQTDDINIQGGNDHYDVVSGNVVLDVNIVRSNLDMYGYWSGLSVARYHNDAATIRFNMDESTVTTMTKYGSSGISLAENTATGTTTKTITDSITFLTNDPGHSGGNMEVNAVIYGNPVVHRDCTIVLQTGGTNDYSNVDFDFALTEGQTITIKNGATLTSAKPILMEDGTAIRGNYVGEVLAADGSAMVISGAGDSLAIGCYPEEDVHTITAEPAAEERGVVTGGGIYLTGDMVTLTAATNKGYRFVHWTENGAVVGEEATITFAADSDHTITAVFEEDNAAEWYFWLAMLYSQQYDISAAAAEGGTVTPAGITRVKYDKSQTYTITPDAGYEIEDVLVDGVSVGAVENYTFDKVRGDHTVTAVFRPVNPFADVSADAACYDAIMYLYENGAMLGMDAENGIFGVSAELTRGMLVTILWRLEGEPAVDYAISFTDVSADEYYTEAIRWAASEGLVLGWEDTFSPDDSLTREQLAAILHRYAESKGLAGAAATTQYKHSDWAESAVLWAEGTGLLAGIGTDLTAPATRAEAAVMVWKCVK